MARFHINPSTGNPGACRATQGKCPFGSADDHYDSPEAAAAAYEKSMGGSKGSVPTATKKPAASLLPEPQYEMIPTAALSEKIEAGDELSSGAVVLSTNTGRKYAALVITDEKKGSKTVHLPLGEVQEGVLKRSETEASKKARDVAMREQHLKRFSDEYKPKRIVAAAKIQGRVEDGYALNYSNLDDLVEAEAHDTVMARYMNMVKQVQDHTPDEANPYSRAYDLYKKDLEEEILSASTRGNSTSTSEASNLFDRGMLSAKARFVRDGVRGLW